jgi:hypothetical protein
MMRLVIAIGFALVASQAAGQVAVPKTYANGQVIDADELNTNLKAIADVVPPRNCTTDQIIKWDDTNEEWKCAEDSLNLVCPVGDALIATGSGWQCQSVYNRLVAFARTDNWQWDGNPTPVTVTALFQSVSNFGSDSGCYFDGTTAFCRFYVTSFPSGILNLNQCDVTISGSALSGASISKDNNVITVSNIPPPANYPGFRAYVDLSCMGP